MVSGNEGIDYGFFIFKLMRISEFEILSKKSFIGASWKIIAFNL